MAFGLIADWNTYKTGPLVNDETGKPYGKSGGNNNDDDQINGMRKQAAASPQSVDDWPAGYDPCRYWEQDETDGNEQTGEIFHFRVRAVDQTIQ